MQILPSVGATDSTLLFWCHCSAAPGHRDRCSRRLWAVFISSCLGWQSQSIATLSSNLVEREIAISLFLNLRSDAQDPIFFILAVTFFCDCIIGPFYQEPFLSVRPIMLLDFSRPANAWWGLESPVILHINANK